MAGFAPAATTTAAPRAHGHLDGDSGPSCLEATATAPATLALAASTDTSVGDDGSPLVSLSPSHSDNAFHQPIDWDNIQIDVEEQDDEGRAQTMADDDMFRFLGLLGEVHDEVQGPLSSAVGGGSGQMDGGQNLDVDDINPDEVPVVYDKDHPEMKLGKIFPTMNDFKMAVRQFAVNEEFELGIEKSDKVRFREYCKGDEQDLTMCTWRIVGRRRGDLTSVMVTVMDEDHSCTATSRVGGKNVSRGWVAEKALPILRKNPTMVAMDLLKKLEDVFGYKLVYDTVWRGHQRALHQLYGSWEDSFRQLFRWRAEVLNRSPGSVVEIGTRVVDTAVYFHRFFYALKPCSDGFSNGCRPYLGIDSTALNGRWNGHLPAATALDGHNWMYPVAFGLFNGETEDNWHWFLSCLHDAIGEVSNLTICTDACKGLENAVARVFPNAANAEKRECFRHLMQNFKKRFHGSSFGEMFPAARAYRTAVFEQHMNNIGNQCPAMLSYLNKHHSLKWMRCEFNPTVKCDYINNNLAECFNNWIRDIKDLPICDLADKLR